MAIFSNRPERAVLLLDDGRTFEGHVFGKRGISVGEVCFNTSMTGYQEILTDPSYAGQIVTMTYPEQGNYGVNPGDVESRQVFARGLIIRDHSPIPSNWRSTQTLEQYLESQDVVGIAGIDTRALTRHVRDTGARPGVIISPCPGEEAMAEGRKALEAFPGLVNADLASEVTSDTAYQWSGRLPYGMSPVEPQPDPRYKVVAYDFGIKDNILRHLSRVGCDIEVVPANTPAADVLSRNPDGVFLSNGPGDPAAVTHAIEAVKELVGKVPLFGICLGHQIMALALGAETFKLKFGHRGGNQPVKHLPSGRVEITAQNHGFAVKKGTMPPGSNVTHIHLNDDTISGFEHPELRLFSVQYHPEASPGPHDAHPHFVRFAEMMQDARL
jgi:carbamoyl-phosphate synthase small subunit